jgi:hypothetical protein
MGRMGEDILRFRDVGCTGSEEASVLDRFTEEAMIPSTMYRALRNHSLASQSLRAKTIIVDDVGS